MLHERKSTLVILAHKKAIAAGLDMDAFVRVFCTQKQKTDAVIGYSLSHVLCNMKRSLVTEPAKQNNEEIQYETKKKNL